MKRRKNDEARSCSCTRTYSYNTYRRQRRWRASLRLHSTAVTSRQAPPTDTALIPRKPKSRVGHGKSSAGDSKRTTVSSKSGVLPRCHYGRYSTCCFYIPRLLFSCCVCRAWPHPSQPGSERSQQHVNTIRHQTSPGHDQD